MTRYKRIIGLIASITTLAFAQQPLALDIAFVGKSSGDQAKPNTEVTMTNISGRSFKILQPKAEDCMQNIRLVVKPEGQDSIF